MGDRRVCVVTNDAYVQQVDLSTEVPMLSC